VPQLRTCEPGLNPTPQTKPVHDEERTVEPPCLGAHLHADDIQTVRPVALIEKLFGEDELLEILRLHMPD
jgi:hypothetical protein